MENEASSAPQPRRSTEEVVLPLALAQFIVGFAATNLNVAISNIVADTKTTVFGVQTAITLFALVLAALLIPGSRLTDIWGRKRSLVVGLVIYGMGGVLAALALSLGTLIAGYSVLEAVGAALMIPPVYTLITVAFPDMAHQARYFGFVSAAGGVGAVLGPLIGGIIASAFTWRASFMLQVAVVILILIMARRLPDTAPTQRRQTFDLQGAFLAAASLLLLILGVLLSRTYGWFLSRQDFRVFGVTVIARDGLTPVWLFMGIGALVGLRFYMRCRERERRSLLPLLPTHLFFNRMSNLGLATQLVQWLVLQGSFFVVAVFLQTVRGYSAVVTGLVLTAATIGLLAVSARASQLAAKFAPTRLIRTGFVLIMLGLVLLMFFAGSTSNALTFLPGLLAIGLGVGVMLTASVNVVQSSFPDGDQGEISGLSRSVSNLGVSLGTALVGSVLTSSLFRGNTHFFFSLLLMLILAGLGWLAAKHMPGREVSPADRVTAETMPPFAGASERLQAGDV